MLFKPHTSIRSAVATTLVSALFVSLSAHAGLLGLGGSAATGAAGGVVGNLGPANVNAAGATASQAATQARVQNTFAPRVPAPAIAAAGQARATQAAVVSTSESAGSRALQATNRVRTGGEFAMDQAAAAEASAAPRSASVSADGSTSGAVQASGRNGSVNGNANANATVSGSANY